MQLVDQHPFPSARGCAAGQWEAFPEVSTQLCLTLGPW